MLKLCNLLKVYILQKLYFAVLLTFRLSLGARNISFHYNWSKCIKLRIRACTSRFMLAKWLGKRPKGVNGQWIFGRKQTFLQWEMTSKNKQGVREYKAPVEMKSSAISPSNTLVYKKKTFFSFCAGSWAQ